MAIDPAEILTFTVFAQRHAQHAASLEDALHLYREVVESVIDLADPAEAEAAGKQEIPLGEQNTLVEALNRLRTEYVDAGGKLSDVDEINAEVRAGRRDS